MRTDDARRVPVASTQKLIERDAMTISSTAVPVFGSTAEKAPDLKTENPAIRAAKTIRAMPNRLAVRVVSLDRSPGGTPAFVAVSLVCWVVSLITCPALQPFVVRPLGVSSYSRPSTTKGHKFPAEGRTTNWSFLAVPSAQYPIAFLEHAIVRDRIVEGIRRQHGHGNGSPVCFALDPHHLRRAAFKLNR